MDAAPSAPNGVNGLVGLVPLAELLADIAGGRRQAVDLAAAIVVRGARELERGNDDRYVAARHQLTSTGVVSVVGEPNSARAAELVIVCEILASAATPPQPSPREPRLVLSAPPGWVDIPAAERLDGLVLDVIRMARRELRIGGAFWNEAGFEMLNSVLIPAIQHRQIHTIVYVNQPDVEHRAGLADNLAALTSAGDVSIRWFTGSRPYMLHAKFVVADGTSGYLGTANLTSWGLSGHVEAGTELTSGQANRFCWFLEQLEAAGLLADQPPH